MTGIKTIEVLGTGGNTECGSFNWQRSFQEQRGNAPPVLCTGSPKPGVNVINFFPSSLIGRICCLTPIDQYLRVECKPWEAVVDSPNSPEQNLPCSNTGLLCQTIRNNKVHVFQTLPSASRLLTILGNIT